MFQITQKKVLKDSVPSTQSISEIRESSIAAKIIGLSSILLISVFSSVNAYAYVNDIEVIRVTAPNMTGGGTFDFSAIPFDSTGNTTAYSDSGDPLKQEACNILRADRPSGCNKLEPPVISTNGCSTIIDVAFYNGFFGNACNSHDTCYSSSGSVRITCDSIFHQQMELRCYP